ncbi:unnamed protein product [Litomosoides sigmodontis]|uniref:Protein YIPF3 n=1 Tax=Litomosoides sigmodontis TaxID=42156 RepID=A0A3P6UJR2_LITSI|nr:unnamed protein product [Litomosoides sigmodontis]
MAKQILIDFDRILELAKQEFGLSNSIVRPCIFRAANCESNLSCWFGLFGCFAWCLWGRLHEVMENTRPRNRLNSVSNDTSVNEDMLHTKLSQMVWEASSKQMKDTLNSYGRIDLFRPYFDVEPRQVRNRLIQSFIPRRPSQMNVSSDMYGPTMIILTLVALLLYSMKSSGYTVQDGTLIGTAMVTCFGAWTHDKFHKLSITLATHVLHLSYLCYLHYGFHVVVEGNLTLMNFISAASFATTAMIIFKKITEIDEILGDMQQSSDISLPLSAG